MLIRTFLVLVLATSACIGPETRSEVYSNGEQGNLLLWSDNGGLIIERVVYHYEACEDFYTSHCDAAGDWELTSTDSVPQPIDIENIRFVPRDAVTNVRLEQLGDTSEVDILYFEANGDFTLHYDGQYEDSWAANTIAAVLAE